MKNQIKHLTLDDLAFEERNKLYGAFEIRRNYNRRVLISLITALSLFSLILIFVQLLNRERFRILGNGFPGSGKSVQIILIDHLPGFEKDAGTLKKIDAEPMANQDFKVVSDNNDREEPAENIQDSLQHTNGTSANPDDGGNGGESVSGSSSGEQGGSGEEFVASAEVSPQFPGGSRAMQEFIQRNLKFPESARQMNVHGSILIYLEFASSGKIMYCKIYRGLHPDLDLELLKVIQMMPPWKPAMQGGRAVAVKCILPVSV